MPASRSRVNHRTQPGPSSNFPIPEGDSPDTSGLSRDGFQQEATEATERQQIILERIESFASVSSVISGCTSNRESQFNVGLSEECPVPELFSAGADLVHSPQLAAKPECEKVMSACRVFSCSGAFRTANWRRSGVGRTSRHPATYGRLTPDTAMRRLIGGLHQSRRVRRRRRGG